MSSMEEGNWYSAMIFLLYSLITIPTMWACGAFTASVGYTSVVEYFTEAWQDFTVEVEVEKVPLEAPFGGV